MKLRVEQIIFKMLKNRPTRFDFRVVNYNCRVRPLEFPDFQWVNYFKMKQ